LVFLTAAAVVVTNTNVSLEALQSELATLRERNATLEQAHERLQLQYDQLEDQMRHFTALLENSSDFIGIADFQGKVSYLNRAGQQLVGFESQEAVANTTIQAYFLPDDAQYLEREILPTVMEKGQWKGEFRFRNFKSGEIIDIDYSLFVLRDEKTGEPIALGSVTRDISEAKAIAEHQQRLIAVIENSSDFIGIANKEGKVLYLNEAGRKMIGLETDEEVAETNIQSYFFPEDLPTVRNELMPEIYKKGRWLGEFRFRNFKTGNPIPISYNLFAVRDQETQEIISLSTVSRDISAQLQTEEERTRLQEQVIQAQQAAIRELGTPLIPLADQIVAMPLVGTIDTSRAQQIMETLLEGCSTYQAEVVILDITGVKVVDSQVADGLVRTARAASLLGSEVVLTGISPEVAQTLVQIGMDMGSIVTRSTLRSGIQYALQTRNLSFED
jgi:rsbT co-antagonist protein RsbR